MNGTRVGLDMLGDIDKKDFYEKVVLALNVELSSLKDRLTRHLDSKQDILFYTEGRLRMAISDLTENLKVLVESSGQKNNLNIFKMEATKFSSDRTPAISEFMVVMAQVPHPLPDELRIDGIVYKMAKTNPHDGGLRIGSIWCEFRNERAPGLEIDERIIVKDMC